MKYLLVLLLCISLVGATNHTAIPESTPETTSLSEEEINSLIQIEVKRQIDQTDITPLIESVVTREINYAVDEYAPPAFPYLIVIFMIVVITGLMGGSYLLVRSLF